MGRRQILRRAISVGKFRLIGASLALIAIAAVVLTLTIPQTGEASAKDRSQPIAQVQIQQVTNCFPIGIDAIGAGNFDEGLALWEECLTDDFSFAFRFAPDADLIECPGVSCPIEEFNSEGKLRSRAETRALFAQFAFVTAGYAATHHNLTNVDVDVHGNNAQVHANVTAWHVVPGEGLDLALGTYTTEVVKEGGDWKIRHELIELISFGRVG